MPDTFDYLSNTAGTTVLVFIYIIIIGVNCLTLLSAVGKWKVYTKAGVEGWKSLIPVYSTWIDFGISWNAGICPVYYVCTLTGSFLLSVGERYLTLTAACLLFVGCILSSVKEYKLAKAFGHDLGFALGLIVLQPLFIVILGFNRSRYRRP